MFSGGKFKFKDSIRERFGKEFALESGGSAESAPSGSAASEAASSSMDYSMNVAASNRMRHGRSSSEHFNTDDSSNKASTSSHYHQVLHFL